MTDIGYRVVFKGEIAPDAKINDVKLKVDFIFKADKEKIKRLFSGEEVVVKKNASIEICEKIRDAFKNAGAIAHIQEEKIPDAGEVKGRQSKEPEPPPLPSSQTIDEKQGANERQTKRADEKFCPSCGELIEIKSLHCPYCGTKQKKEGAGSLPIAAITISMVLFAVFIIGILAAIAIPQFIAYRNKALEADTKSPYETTLKIDLNLLYETEEKYFQAHNRYTNSLTELEFLPAGQVTVEIVSADEYCFEAKGVIDKLEKTYWIDCDGEISVR
jgi:hypothetical protein